jgi:hypothetical protein
MRAKGGSCASVVAEACFELTVWGIARQGEIGSHIPRILDWATPAAILSLDSRRQSR